MNSEVYQPAEDSYFLIKIVSNYISKLNKKEKQDLKILDMGVGSGIISEKLLELGINKKYILAVDINEKALIQVKNNLNIKTKKSNLFSNIDKKNKFDLIIFNPPYLPEHKYDKKLDTTGGKKGNEIILRFIKQLPSYLNNNAIVLILTSSLTPINKILAKIKEHNLIINKIAIKKLFFEELYVWRLKKK